MQQQSKQKKIIMAYPLNPMVKQILIFIALSMVRSHRWVASVRQSVIKCTSSPIKRLNLLSGYSMYGSLRTFTVALVHLDGVELMLKLGKKLVSLAKIRELTLQFKWVLCPGTNILSLISRYYNVSSLI